MSSEEVNSESIRCQVSEPCDNLDDRRGSFDSQRTLCVTDYDSVETVIAPASSRVNDDYSWLEQIQGTSQDGAMASLNPIGSYRGKFINRDFIRATFRLSMVDAFQNTSTLATSLFDHYGRLKEKHIRTDSGVWGAEIDHGAIFLLERVCIYESSCLQDAQERFVKTIMDIATHTGDKNNTVIIVDLSEAHPDRSIAQTQLRFWRMSGFRRIGSTSWFGRTPDPDNAPESLYVECNFDRPNIYAYSSYITMEVLLKDIAKLADPIAVERLRRHFGSVNDPLWQYHDDHDENTVLHIAAINSMPECVEWILEHQAGLRRHRNRHGETPLEALKNHLERQRAQCEKQSTTKHFNQFHGFSAASVSCLVQLSGMRDVQGPEMDRLRMGCSCEECLDGFLSPRMRLALVWQAERWSDLLRDDIADGREWVMLNAKYLSDASGELIARLAKERAMREGFAALATFFALCLEKNKIPTEENVRATVAECAEWPPLCKNYLLQEQGKVSAMASVVFRAAKENDKRSGDGSFQDEMWHSIKGLSECRNDHEFDFVSSMCGFSSQYR